MFFPLRDSIPSDLWPAVNIMLIVACSAVFIFELLLGSRLNALFQAAAFIPARLFFPHAVLRVGLPVYGLLGNIATVFSSMFLHGGWLHIIGNMWFLYIFGDNVEDALGHGRYLLFYLGGGMAAALTQGIISPGSVVPTIGASGAIAAVLGAYMVWFPHARVRTLVFLLVFVTVIDIPALLFLGYWFLLQFFQGTLSLAAAPGAGGIAWFAHIGGFAFGVAVGLITLRRQSLRPNAFLSVWRQF